MRQRKDYSLELVFALDRLAIAIEQLAQAEKLPVGSASVVLDQLTKRIRSEEEVVGGQLAYYSPVELGQCDAKWQYALRFCNFIKSWQ